MFNNLIKKNENFYCPTNGTIIDITKVEDKVFSEKIIGDGIAIIPSDGKVYAPYSGKLTVCFPTGHAYGIKKSNGQEVLLHLGIDTVELEGVGFKTYVKQGKYVKQGELLCEMDLDKINQLGKSTTVIVIFTSGENIKTYKNEEKVHSGEIILELISQNHILRRR